MKKIKEVREQGTICIKRKQFVWMFGGVDCAFEKGVGSRSSTPNKGLPDQAKK